MDLKFSIITVCYNSEDTIKQTIESVLNQTYKNYEHIIVDGDSNDKTLSIIKEYINKSNKIVYISEKDTGIYNAMNKGVRLATGDLVVFLNSDDTFENNALDLVCKYYDNQTDIIYGNISWEEQFNSRIFIKDLNLKPYNYVGSNEKNNELMSLECLEKIKNAHNATFVKREIIKNNLFDESLKICSDYKFFLNMYIQKRKVKYIPYKITTMKMGGISTTQLELGLKEHIKCEKEILGFTTVDERQQLKKIKKQQIIKRISKILLNEKIYVKNRYLNRGWIEKNK